MRVWSTLDAAVDIHAWLGIDLTQNRLCMHGWVFIIQKIGWWCSRGRSALPAQQVCRGAPQDAAASTLPEGHSRVISSGGGSGGQGGGRGGGRAARDSRHPRHLQSADLSPSRQPVVPWAGPGHDTLTLGHSASLSSPKLETNALANQMFSIQNAYESIVIAELHAGSSSLCVGVKEPCRRGF